MHYVTGCDIGNITAVFTSKKGTTITESRLKEATELNKLGGGTTLTINSKELLVGEGTFENNLFKYKKKIYTDLLHYGIAASVPDHSNVNIVIGMPVSQFTPQYKKELSDTIKRNKEIDVKINNKRKRVLINRILIRPESYGVYKLFEAKKEIITGMPTIVIDIGGGTTDISIYNHQGKFTGGTSIPLGLLNYYSLVKTYIFNETGIHMTIEETKEYCRDKFNLVGLDRRLYKKSKDDFFAALYNNILENYKEIERYNIIISGGGAIDFNKHFKDKINHVLIDDNIRTNAETFYQIGRQEFKDE